MESIIIDFLRTLIISYYTYIFSLKIANIKIKNNVKEKAIIILLIFLVTIICEYLRIKTEIPYFIIWNIVFISFIFSKRTQNLFPYSILLIIISLSINYAIWFLVLCIMFFIDDLMKIERKYINFIIITIVYTILFIMCMKTKRINKGIAFLERKLKNEYLSILVLNISVFILYFIIILENHENPQIFYLMIEGMIIVAILMFITIQKSLQLYYKQKMLVRDLEETKEELENKKKEIEELEKENLEFSKISHSIAHRQKSLEYKLNELSMKNEMADEISLRINSLNKALSKEVIVSLKKTEIPEIDDMLKYMKSECVKKKIDFQLQISGNIYKMINNYIKKEDLEILVADHIKNAIIAIEYSKNINRSILVRIGKLDETYGLYIYDSGIEFEIDTLLKLGNKPATTHKDSGGTGMGFMNTFDTLRKHNASFIIEEYGKPVTDNFTKVLKFKFDNKKEFKICTYRKEEIEKQDKEKVLKVENLMF